jgi:hypothetical protein
MRIPLPNGRGSISRRKHVSATPSRAPEQAVFALFQQAVRLVGLIAAALLSSNVASPQTIPRFTVREAPLIWMPGVAVPERSLEHEADSNNPLHWDGDTLYLFNNAGHPWRTSGPDIEHLSNRISAHLGELDDKLQMWIEATYKDEDGTLYGGVHYEPFTTCFGNTHPPTAPRILWFRSHDNGATWEDLGFIIEANPCAIKCDTPNPNDAGGTGDFMFNLDHEKHYFYFYGTSYDPDFEQQGIFAARMRYEDRNAPTGKVQKWFRGGWNEPGRWGRVTPIFPPERDYHKPNGSYFWGPAVHWNTHLGMWVMVLNHAQGLRMTNDGIYISFNRDLGNPAGWTKPVMLLERKTMLRATAIGRKGPGRDVIVPAGVYYGELRAEPDGIVVADTVSTGWYPQIIGTKKGETDKVCGRTARIFLTGMSRLEITFDKPEEAGR